MGGEIFRPEPFHWRPSTASTLTFPGHVGITGKLPILCQVVESAMWENKTRAGTGSGETDGGSFQWGGQENPS